MSEHDSLAFFSVESTEAQFAQFFSQLADDLAKGVNIDVGDLSKRYPQYESELRELWGTLNVTRAAGAVCEPSLSANDLAWRAETARLPFELENYVLQDEIGRGGMGVVYRAIRKQDGRPVAIKMILKRSIRFFEQLPTIFVRS